MRKSVCYIFVIGMLVLTLAFTTGCFGGSGSGGSKEIREGQAELYEKNINDKKPMMVLYTSPG